MHRYDKETTEADIDRFVDSLGWARLRHRDVVRCYSIYMRNECADFLASANSSAWSKIEVECLTEGIRLYDEDFERILASYPAVFGVKGRSADDLRRKWAELLSAAESTVS